VGTSILAGKLLKAKGITWITPIIYKILLTSLSKIPSKAPTKLRVAL